MKQQKSEGSIIARANMFWKVNSVISTVAFFAFILITSDMSAIAFIVFGGIITLIIGLITAFLFLNYLELDDGLLNKTEYGVVKTIDTTRLKSVKVSRKSRYGFWYNAFTPESNTLIKLEDKDGNRLTVDRAYYDDESVQRILDTLDPVIHHLAALENKDVSDYLRPEPIGWVNTLEK